MNSKSFTRSFAAGEIAPTLFGRLDLVKFQTGLAKCLNFLVTPQGPVENRPGFEFVVRAKDTATPPALIPFTYSTTQSFALEFGNGYIRFHTLGGTLLEASKGIAAATLANPGVFTCFGHGYSNGQWVYISGFAGVSARWGVIAGATADTFTLLDMFGNAIDTTLWPVLAGTPTVARLYEIASPYAAADLLDLHYVQSADVLTIVHPSYTTKELRRLGATNWTLTDASFVPTIGTPSAPGATAGGPGGGTPNSIAYATTAVAAGTLEESLASPANVVATDLTVAGNYVDITPVAVSPVAGAVRYNIYKANGGVFGYIGQSDGSAFRDNNITPDMSKTPPLGNASFPTAVRATSYFEQRRCFGGSASLPQTIWTTRSATEANVTYSIPTQGDDAITARIVAREAQTVRHLVPLGDLLALTTGGVWRIASSDGGAITPSTFSAKPQSYVGASNVQPVVTSDSILYAQDRGGHVREVMYQWNVQRYTATDVSVLSPHLFDFRAIRQMTFSTSPYQVLWAVRDDGVLLGLTYQPEHEVKAWHQHDTAGSFESVCAIPEGGEDGVYAVVQRTVQGQPWYYIERLHSRQFATLDDAFFVDSGLTYSGAATSTISGLWHLEGQTVSVLADGGVHPARTVAGGTITLEAPASTVQIGLGITADVQTLPVAQEAAAGFGQGTPKNVSEVWLRMYQSSGIKAGPSFDKLMEYPQRTVADNYSAPPGMITGIAQLKLTPTWQTDGSVCLRQSNPLPLTLVAMTLETASGG